MPFCPKRLPQPQNLPISDTFLSQHFLFFDNRRKIKSRKTRFVARPPLSHLRWRFAPLRGTQHRCAGASRHPSGALRAQRAARAPCYEHEKKAGGGGYFIVGRRGPRTSSRGPRTPCHGPRRCGRRCGLFGQRLDGADAQARPTRPSDDWFHRLLRQPECSLAGHSVEGRCV